MSESAAKVNWRRGAFRVWLVAAAVWLLFGGYIVLSGYSGIDEFPRRYYAYLPDCPLEEPAGGNPFGALQGDNYEPSPMPRLCVPALWLTADANETEVSRAQRAYAQCIATRDREIEEAARLRTEEREACLANQQLPSTIAAAKTTLRQAQLEWIGNLLLRLAVWFGIPVVVWFGSVLLFRLSRWIVRGFTGPG